MQKKRIEQICDLWRYQDSQCRLTTFLKQRIDGYNNGRLYNIDRAKKDRDQWLQKKKLYKEQKGELDKLKQKYLDKMLHPQNTYVNPKLKNYEIVLQAYGNNNSLLKNYVNSGRQNIKPNIIDFKLYQQISIKDIKSNKYDDYVKIFRNKFGSILQHQSPQFWQFLLYDIFDKILKCKDKDDDHLSHQLNILLNGQKDAIKYLITFRNQIVKILLNSGFNQQKVKECKIKSGIKKNKQKIVEEKEYIGVIDFIKMKDIQLIQQFPTLKRYDHLEYIHYRIEPLPLIKKDIELIKVSDFLQQVYQKCFQSQYLNTIQSIVFNTAFKSNENMLVCAPTGAGKTNIALLTILQAIKSVSNPKQVKIVYISPMKALVNELVEKFSYKFHQLKIKQSTGDIQLSQKQLNQTNIVVTTPEKWDVTTRKGGSIFQKIHLVILDQIHLLNDDRGWVIQTIVARLFRTIEKTHNRIRLIGLSATLPNYGDVGDFLRVNRKNGLYNFDNSYRPVPLTINFIGIKNPKDLDNNISHNKSIKNIYDEKCYDLIINYLKNDKQVLIFVHSRKATYLYCDDIIKKAKDRNDLNFFISTTKINQDHFKDWRLKNVLKFNVGFHNAGMIRSDRNAVEKMFIRGQIKVLLATATLAWGVNLPAYAVIIKGTNIYDPNQFGRRDLSILDIQQMFGRAGRPQYDTKGQAILMSDHNKVNFYMGALTNTTSIDSQFLKNIQESLNAQISSGTITSQDDAFEWIKYTYLAVHLRRCPQVYNCHRDENQTQREINYDKFMRSTIKNILYELETIKLINYNHNSNNISSTQLGRITSHYYIKCQTMKHFCQALNIFYDRNNNKKFDYMTDFQLLNILCECKEFQSVRPREDKGEDKSEKQELVELLKFLMLEEGAYSMRMQIDDEGNQTMPLIQTPQKVLLLIKGYLRFTQYKNFSLMNDTQYIIQNSIRLLRCMLDLCSKKKQASNMYIILKWCKYIENRVKQKDCPLKQFTRNSFEGCNMMRSKMKKNIDRFLSQEMLNRFESTGKTTSQFLENKDDVEIMAWLKLGKGGMSNYNYHIINELKTYCAYLPRVILTYSIKPIAQTIIQIDVFIKPIWKYSSKWHLKSQIFWILFERDNELLHSETISISEEYVIKQRTIKTIFYIRHECKQSSYNMTVTSDRWLVDYQQQISIDLQQFGLDMNRIPFTSLLNLHPLPITALKNPIFQSLYKNFKFFNPIQTQLFFSLYQTNNNILIGAPTGSGKTIMSQLAILGLFKNTDYKCVYIAPLKSLVKQRLKDWIPRFKAIKKSVVELSGDYTPDLEALNKADIIVTTPQKWDGITRNKDRTYVHKVKLLIFDQIHLLSQQRGAVLEVIVSRMNKLKNIRMIGLSTAMANGNDVAQWFGANRYSFYNFRPKVRPTPIESHIEGFNQKNYCPRMALMNKPAFNAIRQYSDSKPVLIFVSSRRQTKLTANDLISYSQLEYHGYCPYVKCSSDLIQHAIQSVHDEYLKQTLSFGIVMHHAGLDANDREICQQLFVNNKVQVMIATSTLAWGVNFPARLVIIKGTEYFDPKQHKFVDMQTTDLLQMIGRAGRPQYDDKGIAFIFCQSSKKDFYKQFLFDPFPIESSLHEQLDDHINAQIARGQITNIDECIEWITWSYMFRRILKNPVYYSVADNSVDNIKKWLRDTVQSVFARLQKSKCIELQKKDNTIEVMPTQLGFIGSNYYLKHETINRFNEEIRNDMQYNEILKLLSKANEFNQVPLRHNEDIHNRELSQIAPYKIKNYSCPNEKTFLLLQMHLYNLPYPIRDYLTDCSIVLDSANRVIMALIEIAKCRQLANVIQKAIYIQQGLYQGLGCNIPYITWDIWKQITNRYNGLCGVVQSYNNNTNEFLEFVQKRVIQSNEYKKDKIMKEIKQALQSYPQIRVSYTMKSYNSEKNIEQDKELEENGEGILKLVIRKDNKGNNRVKVQKRKKIKDANWWILVRNNRGKLLELKRIIIKNIITLKIILSLPSNFHKDSIEVLLLSDSYIGLDQLIRIQLI